MNFCGEFHNTLDAKGRISIPAEFREILAKSESREGLVVTKNRDGGLTAYPPSEWDQFVARLEAQPAGRTKTALNRLYLAPQSSVGFDKQGRVPLRDALRKWAGIDGEERDLVVVGNFRRIDIFSKRRYAEVVVQDVDLLNEADELVADLDLP